MRIFIGLTVLSLLFFSGITLGQPAETMEHIEIEEKENAEQWSVEEEKLQYDDMQRPQESGYLLHIANGLEKGYMKTQQIISTFIYELANAVIG